MMFDLGTMGHLQDSLDKLTDFLWDMSRQKILDVPYKPDCVYGGQPYITFAKNLGFCTLSSHPPCLRIHQPYLLSLALYYMTVFGSSPPAPTLQTK